MKNIASGSQRKLFFALCREKGYETEKMKERAKSNYGLASFKDISGHQISLLIDKLQGKKEHKHKWELDARSASKVYYTCKCSALFIVPR